MLNVPVSVGELVDKITILEIKVERATGSQRDKVWYELQILKRIWNDSQIVLEEGLWEELKAINLTLWECEDRLRELEGLGQFDETFIHLARQVYLTNDRRAALKKKINQQTGSAIEEVKVLPDIYLQKINQ